MNAKPNREAMLAAIQTAECNKTPFGASLAMGDQVFSTAANKTGQNGNSATHAGIQVIRELLDLTKKDDLSGFTLYSTCKPCTICINQMIETGIKTVVYGCEAPLAGKAIDESQIRNKESISESIVDVNLIGNFLKVECEALLRKFS